MNTKHPITERFPAPWYATEWQVSTANDRPIATVCFPNCATAPESREIARLMAAAPTMYEALLTAWTALAEPTLSNVDRAEALGVIYTALAAACDEPLRPAKKA